MSEIIEVMPTELTTDELDLIAGGNYWGGYSYSYSLKVSVGSGNGNNNSVQIGNGNGINVA